MTGNPDTPATIGKEELLQIEQLLCTEKFAGNPLLPQLAKIVSSYRKLQQFADAIAVENQRIKTQLSELSRSLELTTRIDIMTGLSNRRGILNKIEQEYSRAIRHNRTFSIIIADIDDFRHVNERYGFNAGDEVLVEIANVIRVCIRSEDICSRWSGEQFLLLLPETEISGAEAVAQKICQTISMTEFRVNKPGIRVTLSLGVSEYNSGDTMFQCISRADQGLSQAKRGGKNRYFIMQNLDQQQAAAS